MEKKRQSFYFLDRFIVQVVKVVRSWSRRRHCVIQRTQQQQCNEKSSTARGIERMPPPSPTSPPTIGSVCVVLTAAVKRLALKFVLTTLSIQAVLFFGFGKARYREVYAHDSAVRMWAVVVFVFNFAQAFASQMLSGSADHGTRDLVVTSTNVNIVALFMYSVYSAGGSTGDDLAASRRVGGGVSPRMYIMWTLTTPSLIRAVALRARLSSVAQETTERPLPKSGDMRVRGNGGGDRRSHEPVSPRGSSYAAEGNSSPTASSPSWQSGFRDEKVANIASLAMYVTGFLGGVGENRLNLCLCQKPFSFSIKLSATKTKNLDLCYV